MALIWALPPTLDTDIPTSTAGRIPELNKLVSVADAVKVKVVRKTGANYSNVTVNIDDLMSSDGRYLNVPNNVCLQIRFPRNDIKGSVK